MTLNIKAFLDLIKFEHTIFALPFAYLGYVWGSNGNVIWSDAVWVTLAMVGARTAGMCLNRILDLKWDAKNPRTKAWPHVTGEVKSFWIWSATALGIVLLVLSAWKLNPLCLKLAPVAVLLLCTYPYLKRFTPLCHFGIGLVLASAPLGGWIAATGTLGLHAWLLGASVLFWVAGFDIFYSLQDVEFDRASGLHSIAADFGTTQAVWVTRVSHVLTLIFLSWLGIISALNWIYWIGLVSAALFLLYEHWLMRGGQIGSIKKAFFTANAALSTAFSFAAVVSIWSKV